MEPGAFKSKLAGRVVRAAGGYWAFIPAPPPPPIDYTPELALLLSQAAPR
jgi:hypothetical protein